MQNLRRSAILAKAEALENAFREAGALPIHADALMPADVLLDLYGEEIRARAYVTNDPILGERMMRPDFTVPIVERHMAEGAEPARYCYNGPVWRMKNPKSDMPTEYIQVGFELFDRSNPAQSDAEVFSLFSSILPDDADVTVGDIGLLRSAIFSLKLSEKRRNALLRHLWRPERFRKLMDRFAGRSPIPELRVDLITKSLMSGEDALIEEAGNFVGKRSEAEIKARIKTFKEDRKEEPIAAEDVDAIEMLLDMDLPLTDAPDQLEKLEKCLPDMAPAIAHFNARLDLLSTQNKDLARVRFAGSFGRTSMEYYDGFVFAFTKLDRVLASGGRYDALTLQLGEGREIPAVGGVIRPEALIEGDA